MSSNFSFQKCEISEWDQILENLDQSTFFCKSYFLKSLGSKFHLWKILQGKEIKAGVCLNVDDTEKKSIENEFVIHNGIFFKLDQNRVITKKREDEFQITSFIIENLVKQYDTIFLSLDPSIVDIRPFQWFNYKKNAPKFKIEIKYTSILDLSNLRKNESVENSTIFENLEPVRRYSVRQAIKEEAKVKFVKDKEMFLDLYKNLLIKIDPKNYENKINIVSKIIESVLKKNKGIIVNTEDKDKNLLYSVFCGWDNNKAYYIFGVGSEENKKSWQGTIGQWSLFRYIVENTEIDKFDFEGVNSPQRGWFKLGFGGKLVPYYQLNYEKFK